MFHVEHRTQSRIIVTRNSPQRGASTTTEPLADDIVAHNRQLVTNYADALYDARAEDILAWADEHVPGDIAVTMSMENTVLAELASRYVPRAGAATNQLAWV